MEPPALTFDHLTILDGPNLSSAHRRALGAAFAALQTMAVEALRQPPRTRVLRCEHDAARARRRHFHGAMEALLLLAPDLASLSGGGG